MKYIFTHFLYFIFLFIVPTSSMWAYDVEVDGIYYNLDADVQNATVVSGDRKYTGSVLVPPTITVENSEYSVTSIGDLAFQLCEDLTSVTIPNSVKTIGNSAFSGCENLSTITIPNSVTSIGQLAFYDCKSITSITLPNSVSSIGAYAFCLCENLAFISLPNSITSIEEATFEECLQLAAVTIPNSVLRPFPVTGSGSCSK